MSYTLPPPPPHFPFPHADFVGAGRAEMHSGHVWRSGRICSVCDTICPSIAPGQVFSPLHHLLGPGARPPSTAPHQPSPGTQCGGCTAAGWCGSALPGCTCVTGGWPHLHPQQPEGRQGDRVLSPRQNGQRTMTQVLRLGLQALLDPGVKATRKDGCEQLLNGRKKMRHEGRLSTH